MTGPIPRWWGWAEPTAGGGPSNDALEALGRELGGAPPPSGRVPLEQVELPDRALEERVARAAVAIVGADHVRTGRRERVTHALGKNYPDLVRIRAGDGSSAPDAVIHPADDQQVARLLELFAAERIAVTPFGGGTSVVGGVEPLGEGFAGTVSLDLDRLDHLGTDRRSLVATGGAGLRGRLAEARLAGRGLTLGHFPQSFEFATIGGYVATRSAGQASSGYGRIDDLVLGVRMQTPAGPVESKVVPATAAGPALRELLVGSEGTFGVITEVSLAVRPLPQRRRYEGWSFRTFEAGVEALRTLAQAHAAPDVARLSDAEETRYTLLLSASGSTAERLAKLYLRARGHDGGCIAIVGFEGAADEVEMRAKRAGAVLSDHGGLALGSRPGQAWLRGRYSGPYLRDDLLDRGYLVETLETATTWTRLPELHDAVAGALRDALTGHGTPPLVGCHVSHLYGSGASLYFTFIAHRRPGEEIDQWRAAKRAASEAIVAHGGTITHHHAVGRDHTPWMAEEIGPLGVEILRAVKGRLDPAGIMNPGKLLPPDG